MLDTLAVGEQPLSNSRVGSRAPNFGTWLTFTPFSLERLSKSLRKRRVFFFIRTWSCTWGLGTSDRNLLEPWHTETWYAVHTHTHTHLLVPAITTTVCVCHTQVLYSHNRETSPRGCLAAVRNLPFHVSAFSNHPPHRHHHIIAVRISTTATTTTTTTYGRNFRSAELDSVDNVQPDRQTDRQRRLYWQSTHCWEVVMRFIMTANAVVQHLSQSTTTYRQLTAPHRLSRLLSR